MFRDPPQIQNYAGYAALNINPTRMFSNCINIITGGNRRSAYRSAVSMEEMTRLYDLALGTETDWLGTDSDISGMSARERLDRITEVIRPLAVELSKTHQPVNDLGETIKGELMSEMENGVKTNGWNRTWVDNPALAYQRDYIELVELSGLEHLDCTYIALPGSDWSRKIAEALMVLDKTRYSVDLIPRPTNVGVHEFKDQPFGQMFSGMEQATAVWAWFTLYNIQGMVFSAHVNRRWNMKCLELAHALEPRAREALDRLAENYEFLLKLPMHPLLTYIASSLQTGTVITYANKYDLHYRWGCPAEELARDKRNARDKMSGPIMRAALLDVALARVPTTWSEGNEKMDVAGLKDLPKLPDGVGTIGHGARLVRSIDKLAAKWDAIASHLKWGSLSGKVDEVWQAAADYNITDGLDYGEDPTACVLGLKPAISAGDFRIAGFFRRSMKFWDAREGERLEFSVVPVKGYQSATTGTQLYERNFIVAGAWMGEDNTDRQFASLAVGGDDPVGVAVLEHWRTRLKEYVRYGYQEPSGELVKDVWHPTDWSTWTWGDDKAVVSHALIEAFKGQTEVIDYGVFLYREYFSHRCVVRRARESSVDRFSEFGVWVEAMPQDGHVRWNGDVEVSQSDAPLQQLVDIAVVPGIAGMEGLPTPSGDEAVAVST